MSFQQISVIALTLFEAQVVDDRYSFQFLLMISGFCHGLIFNLLHKSLNASLTNDTITSLAVHLLELAVTYPQKDFSGKEVAVAVQVINFFWKHSKNK